MIGTGPYQRHYGAEPQRLRGEFFMDVVKDELASFNAGRDIFREVERIRIFIPGATASMVVKNVNDQLRQDYGREYEAFRAGHEAPADGTPIEEWPVLNKAQVAELRYKQVRTVEELAALSDLACQTLCLGATMLRQRAKAWLDEAEHEALTTKLAAENDVMRSRVATLETQVAELGRQLVAMAQQQRPNFATSNEGHPFQTYVPGNDDPFQRPGLPAVAETASALDAFASMPPPRARPDRGELNFDPAAQPE